MASPIAGIGLANPGALGKGAPVAKSSESGSSFADLVRGVAKQTLEATNQGEVKALGAVSKDASLVDVVTAVTNAEVALETAVAVRDKVIAAYQEIIRMPI
jgi:flagellar hook-basal body complex protein FliE